MKKKVGRPKTSIMVKCDNCGKRFEKFRYKNTKRSYCNIICRFGKKIEENFFEVIDTEEKAYWLGFITADGSISKNTLRINLKSGDSGHLKKFLKALKSNNKVRYAKSNANTYCYISLTSKKMIMDLKKLGITSKKAFKVKPIDIDKIHESHYWRGLVDGDGSVHRKRIGLYGNEYMTKGFELFVKKHTGSKANVYNGATCHQFVIASKSDVRKITFILYNTSKVYLLRKKRVAIEILNDYKPKIA